MLRFRMLFLLVAFFMQLHKFSLEFSNSRKISTSSFDNYEEKPPPQNSNPRCYPVTPGFLFLPESSAIPSALRPM